jgi:sulfide:quinone oxidoreductase
VIATGAEIVPDGIPGHEAAHQFYSLQGALRLRDALAKFPGGRIVVAIGGVPYKCPPAPAEAACLLDYRFAKLGRRDQVHIHYLSPLGRVFPIESFSPKVQELFERKGITYTTFFNVERVDPVAKVVHSLEGESVPFDLLILVPPHRGVPFAKASGLADAGGWIRTDKHALEVKGHEGTIWALGDATDIPISKSGAAAHFEAKVVAKNVAARLRGETPRARYAGRVFCFFDAGFRRATALRFDYGHPPPPMAVSRRWYIAKMMMNRLYWTLIPKARA